MAGAQTATAAGRQLSNSGVRYCFLTLLILTASVEAMADPIATELTAPGPNGPLQGTLLTPDRPGVPVVLIIPGSGPTDRNGDNPLGVTAAPYRHLAQELAAAGIASLRIDKRGLFGSAAAIRDANAVTIQDYADDVQAWIDIVKQKTHAPCIWLLGHSEGGLIALAAARRPADLCGLVLAATPGKKLGTILRDQLEANPANAPILGQALPAIDALEAGRHIDTTGFHPALQALFQPALQNFLIDAFSYDPAALLRRYAGPVLILQGERDLQVGVENARLLAAADPQAKLVLAPNATHVLKAATRNEPQANLATYQDPTAPIDPDMMRAITAFIAAH